MPPIKLKLSLSSASLAAQHAASLTPSASDKGKGKEVDTPSSSTANPVYKSNGTPATNGSLWSNVSPAPVAGPSRLSHTSALAPAFSPHTPTPLSATSMKANGTAKSATKPKARQKVKSKLGRMPKSNAQSRQAKSAPTRPTAIPPHVYSAPDTPISSPGQMAPPPLPGAFRGTATPSPAPESHYASGFGSPLGQDGVNVKQEMMDIDGQEHEGSPDPLSLPMTPGEGEGQGTPYRRGRTGGKWVRLRKPLKEQAGKVMVELRRRDEYALFSEPVDTDEFPTYLSIVGGADKMMDLSTMQSKIDNGQYRSLDAMEADLRLLVEAAQKFNPPGTVPYRSANTILTYGLKHIERYRNFVITPTPSPTRDVSGTPARQASADASAEDAEAKFVDIEVPPQHRIPVEMLDYPPNSLPGLAVGWNLNGGKRVYIKRELRARERFPGKWRQSDFDGTRNLSEMDDIEAVFAPSVPLNSRQILDWKAMRRDTAWWDWPGPGGVFGQPPVPFTKYPVRPPKPTRQLGSLDWGNFPDIEAERMMLAQRKVLETAGSREGMSMEAVLQAGEEVLAEQLRPTAPKVPLAKRKRESGNSGGGPGFVNTYDARPPGEWLRDMADGDVRGEAYRTSVRRFLEGATRSARASATSNRTEVHGPPAGLDLGELHRYVNEVYHNGVVSSSVESTARCTLLSLQQLRSSSVNSPHSVSHPSPPLIPLPHIRQIAQTSHARTSLRHIFRAGNALDISPFIFSPEEFTFTGKHPGMDKGLRWVAGELERMAKSQSEVRVGKRKADDGNELDFSTESKKARMEDSTAKSRAVSSPLSTAPSSPPKTEPSKVITPTQLHSTSRPATADDEAQMKALRLEILSICKFFPLTGLKQLPKAVADKVLPVNVRGLLTAPE